MWPVTVLNIFLLRANPQDLPTSRSLTAMAVALYFAADVGVALTQVPFDRALLAAGMDTLVLGLLTQLALNVRRHGERLSQTLLALTGCGVLFGAISMTINALVPDQATSFYAFLPALFWLFAVYGHILHHALEVPYVTGVAAAGAYLFLSVIVTAPFLTSAALGS
jgi:hypothetical protein